MPDDEKGLISRVKMLSLKIIRIQIISERFIHVNLSRADRDQFP